MLPNSLPTQEYKLNCKLMGSAFELIVVHTDADKANELLVLGMAEIQRIEALLSEFKNDSFTSLINKQAGKKAAVLTREIYQLIKRCNQISDLTNGAFDISVGPLKKLYNFKHQDFSFPSKKAIEKVLNRVGYKKISCSDIDNSVKLLQNKMHISFAAIGKGYAADCVRKLWIKKGVQSAVINASGDLTTIGQRADGSSWRIGISNPDKRDEILFYIPVHNASVATSGDSEQFFIRQNIKYSHNINPKDGLPLIGIKSISVFSPSAELSDALATAVYVMGIKKGMRFIEQLPNTHCILIDVNSKVFFSKGINLLQE